MPRALLQSLLIAGLVSPGSAVAEPMDLNDPRPRWVTIAFEDSPPHQPGRLDTRYTPALPAWLEPEAPGRLRVTLARGLVEQYLMAADDPKPGSFGDFVWIFDASSGDVIQTSGSTSTRAGRPASGVRGTCSVSCSSTSVTAPISTPAPRWLAFPTSGTGAT
jgi:hypothetical protein